MSSWKIGFNPLDYPEGGKSPAIKALCDGLVYVAQQGQDPEWAVEVSADVDCPRGKTYVEEVPSIQRGRT